MDAWGLGHLGAWALCGSGALGYLFHLLCKSDFVDNGPIGNFCPVCKVAHYIEGDQQLQSQQGLKLKPRNSCLDLRLANLTAVTLHHVQIIRR